MIKSNIEDLKVSRNNEKNFTRKIFPITETKINVVIEAKNKYTINGLLLSSLNKCIISIKYTTTKNIIKWITGTVVKSHNDTMIIFPQIQDVINYEIHSSIIDGENEVFPGCVRYILEPNSIEDFFTNDFYFLNFPGESNYSLNRNCITCSLFISNKNFQYISDVEDVYFAYYISEKEEFDEYRYGDHFPLFKHAITASPILTKNENFGTFTCLNDGFFLDCEFNELFKGAPVIVSKLILLECLPIRKEFVVGIIQGCSKELDFPAEKNLIYVKRIMANDDGGLASLSVGKNPYFNT